MDQLGKHADNQVTAFNQNAVDLQDQHKDQHQSTVFTFVILLTVHLTKILIMLMNIMISPVFQFNSLLSLLVILLII